MKLWGIETPRTFRAIWVAEELGLAYELNPIGSRTGETRTKEFTALSRKQKIPFLVDGDVYLSESLAICRYLRDAYPGGLWVPESLTEKAKEDEWCSYIYGELDETSLYVMRRHGELAEIYGGSAEVVAGCKAYAERHFEVTAYYLNGHAAIMPGGFGLADIFLVSCIDWAHFYDVAVPGALNDYKNAIGERPAYQRAMQINYKKLLGG